MCGSKIDIVQENTTSSYCAKKDRPDHIVHGLQVVSYMGFDVRKEKEKKRGSLMYLRSEVKSKHNITPSSGSMSAATSLILIHENTQPSSVDELDVLIYTGSGCSG